jgi:O-antigen/teichoic acid export membrane protein
MTSQSRLPQRLAALIEQCGNSGANLVGFVLLARALAPEHWGAFGFAYALLMFAQGFQRALVTIPMIPFTVGGGGWAAARLDWAGANARLALAGVLLLGGIATVGLALDAGWTAVSLAMAAVLLPAALAHEFARRAAVQEQRFDLLAAMGVAYALPLLAVAGWAAWGPGAALPAGLHPAWLAALALGCGLVGAALAYRLAGGGPLLPLAALVRLPEAPAAGYPAFAGWAVGSHLGYSGYNFGVQAMLAAIAGPAAVGAFHACRTLVQPVTVLQSAIDGIDKPRAARAWHGQGAVGLRAVLWRSLAWAAVPSLPFLLLVALAAGPLLVLLYGPVYAQSQAVVVAWCLVAGCSLLSQPVESGLYVTHRPRALFVARSVAALVSLGAAVPLVQAHAEVGALVAMALGFALAALFGTLALRRLPSKP